MRITILTKKRSVVVGVLALLVMAGVVLFNPKPASADECSVNGIGCWHGYFFGQYDGGRAVRRWNVIDHPAMDNVHDPEALVSTTLWYLGCIGGAVNDNQNGTGAAFIVLTMLGYPPGTPKNVACQQFNEWAATVREWAPYTNYNLDYDFSGINTRSTKVDVTYFPMVGHAVSIVFFDPRTGEPLYGIKKDCANPVGVLKKLDRQNGIPKNYALTPTIQSISPTEIESGAKMNASGRVDNNGEIDSRPSQWEITMMTVQPGKRVPHEGEGVTVSGTAPCQGGGGAPPGDYFGNPDSRCANVERGNGVFPRGTTPLNAYDKSIGDVPVGTRICFALSVQPRSSNDGQWAHSQPVCTVVGKKPKLQIWGGDVAVRGNVETSTSVKSIDGTNKTFGSWVEYGVFSVGPNSRFASGSGLNNQTDGNQAAWSKLTFANKDESGADAFGRYSPAGSFRTLPGVASFFSTITNKVPIGGSRVDISGLTFPTGGAVQVHTAGNLTITGGSIPAGRSVVIISSGTVTIEGNINYADGPFGRLQDIPQVVIIAQNINIQDNVSHIDAWLVADGVINTCHNFGGNLTSTKCATRLDVNGPVIAGRLILNRTAGSDPGPASGDPAERFNLRPDAHLWAYLQASGASKAQTVYSVELPPRF